MQLIGVEEAVLQIPDQATVLVGGSGAGHAVPQLFIDTLASVYGTHGRPCDLTTVRVVGIGDFGERGFSQLALPGLMRRTIGSNLGNEPALGEMVAAGMLEAYSFPQGVLSQLCREIAAGRPGLLTAVGLDTYVDPRHGGGKQGAATEDLVEVVELADQEWLFFRAFPIDVAVIRGSVIDEDGNLSLEDEAIDGEMLAMAMAAHNSGGTVIAQARRLVARGSLAPRRVAVPGALIDLAYLDPEQTQTYRTAYSPFYAGQMRAPSNAIGSMPHDIRKVPLDIRKVPLDIRKVIARRSLLEFRPGDICNLGFGISQAIGAIVAEEGIDDRLVLTVEQGQIGGIPAGGADGGASINQQAIIDQPSMFDFYDGGGLDIASLSFAEIDAEGNVNVHAFEGRLRGPGGFPNISARTRRLCFVGAFTAGGLVTDFSNGRLVIEKEGSTPKFVQRVREVSFSARMARARRQEVRYITERAVFALQEGGVTLIEIADGIDVERQVIDRMGFRPRIADPLGVIDPRVFSDKSMGLVGEFGGLLQ